MLAGVLGLILAAAPLAQGAVVGLASDALGRPPCPGYKAVNAREDTDSFSVDLKLAGKPCNMYGIDLKDLVLTVEYQTGKFLDLYSHIHVADIER